MIFYIKEKMIILTHTMYLLLSTAANIPVLLMFVCLTGLRSRRGAVVDGNAFAHVVERLEGDDVMGTGIWRGKHE